MAGRRVVCKQGILPAVQHFFGTVKLETGHLCIDTASNRQK